MKILTRHLLKNLFGPLFYCLLGFGLIFIIDNLFNNFSDFLESGIQPLEILYYYSLVLPPVIVLVLPVCLFLAILYSLSQLVRHNEIVAMRAGGVSIYRILLPFIGVGIGASLLVAIINEQIVPDATWRSEKFLQYQKTGRDKEVFFTHNLALKHRNHVWMAQKFDTRDHSMRRVELVKQRPDGSDAVKIQAEKVRWLDGRWWFMDMTVQSYKKNGDLDGPPELILQQEMRDLPETPETFLAEIKNPQYSQYFSSREMLSYLRSKKNLSSKTRSRLMVDLYTRYSTPFICIIVTLIGVPVGSHTGRRGTFSGIVMAMCLFFGFYLFQLAGQALGKQEFIPAWLGGWLPVLVYGIISPFMIYRIR